MVAASSVAYAPDANGKFADHCGKIAAPCDTCQQNAFHGEGFNATNARRCVRQHQMRVGVSDSNVMSPSYIWLRTHTHSTYDVCVFALLACYWKIAYRVRARLIR